MHLKTSFAPISDPDTTILVLGTMPGDRSIALNEYYGHARNKFWKIISAITNNALPLTYAGKKQLLLNCRIGVWDVAQQANRKGSLDTAIKDVVPNDLDSFITRHSNLKVIGFNGIRARTLYDLYFERKEGIRYVSLPSTSPANAGITFENSCNLWRQLLTEGL